MSKKKVVVFENKEFQVTVVPGNQTPPNLRITRKGGKVSIPAEVKIIAEDDGLTVFAENGNMSIISNRVHQGVHIRSSF